MAASLDQIADFPTLVEYLRDELEWPIPDDISLDEATYDVTPEEIGLKAEAIGGGIEIKQLRPLNRAQPWGVFFLNLPNAKLPVTLVRNILGKLAVKKRASANKAQQAAFAKHDLLFIAATGASSERRLAFAHFADDEVKGDAAILKVLGWDANDTPRRLGLTEASLKTKLHWPDDPGDADHWRKQWGEAFAHSDTRNVVRDSKTMAKALAALARRIRERAKELIAAQTDQGSLVKLHKAFKEALIHDLTPEGFADTYAQTIAYGLLSAAISRSSGALVQENVTDVVHPTSPFLKEMLGTFIEAGGRRTGKANAGLDFDELGITEVVELLRNADMEAVLADFDRRNPDEDPVIHFYELFLKEYDSAQKVKRGVFYTPRPVVGFIVRSVDEVLKTEFGLADGLASTATWGEVIAAKPEIALPDGAKTADPFVRILDPATGTGTFLVECVNLIHKTMVAKWEALGKREAEINALWNDYVPKDLLPRLTGFELMMAPYAIAHVKLGLKLADTGYKFASDGRAQIYLTNALEPAQNLNMQLAFMSEALAHEAQAANQAKQARFTIVIGNPPYAISSQNNGKWITKAIDDYKKAVRSERNLQPLSDDYIKFLRLSQYIIDQSGTGIVSLITNHTYISGVIHRGMRENLLSSFSSVDIVNLHGSALIGLADAIHGTDENVFDIQQGVSIGQFSSGPGEGAGVRYTSVWGPRKQKYERLSTSTARSEGSVMLSPRSPTFLLEEAADRDEGYDEWPTVSSIFGAQSTGLETGRDECLIAHDPSDIYQLVADLMDKRKTAEWIKDRYGLTDTSGWPVSSRRRQLQGKPRLEVEENVRRILYRPFDQRVTLFNSFLRRQQLDNMKNMTLPNVALVSSRLIKGERPAHAFVATAPIEKILLSPKTSNNAFLFPLWLKPQGTDTRTLPNIATAFVQRIAALTGLAWDDCVEGPKQGALGGIVSPKPKQTAMFAQRRERGEAGRSFGPRDLFDYIYAVLHSPAYRERYADYLKSDFARIPLPASRALFEALVPLGTQLVALHLLDAEALPILKDPKSVRLAGSGEARVDLPAARFEDEAFVDGRMYVSANRWFETVPRAAADFHIGGYRPARKWLKDRTAKGGANPREGRILTEEDTVHYRRMIVALTRTAELTPKIDEEIGKHGGWPEAFRGMSG